MPITFKVGFQVDDKELTQGLSGIRKDIENAFNVKSGMSAEMQKATQQAIILEKAIKRATTDKGISYYSLTSELAKAGTNAAKLTSTLAAGGKQFSASLNAANIALATADRNVISLNSKIKEMSRVMTQSFKFTAAQTFIQAISNEVREAYQWVEELNTAITNIGVVTGKTASQLDLVTQSAIQGAKELRIAASEYAEGQLIFYQQGLSDDEVTRRTEITVKAAAAANQSMADMSSQLTAIWNTYKMTGDEMQRAASVGAKMAGDTAVDFADIAEAMQTAAAPAEQMGVSYNSLAAIIATVGDTTQQSASVIGNAFKTIFSRFQQLKSEGTDGEVTLNRVSSQLQELGVNVLDSSGQLRQLDDVITEVGNAWDGWSSKQQLAIAQLVGGTRQYGQFLTLMNNFGKYQDLLSSANVEDGSALEQQYASSLNSIESHALNASEAWKRAFSDLFDEDVVKDFYSLLEGMGNAVGGLIDGLGGLPGILTITAMLLSQKIVPSLINGARQAALMYQNLNPDRRRANIEKEYTAQTTQIDKRLGETDNEAERESLNIQRQKTEFGRKVAVINDEINTKLRTASGEYKINLEYQQKMLQSAQELYQSTLDQLSALSQESQKNSNLLKIEEKRAQVAMERAQAQAAILGGEATTASNEARQATQERQNLENQYNANNSKLQQAIQDRANKNPKSKSYAKADAEVSRLTAEQAKLSEQLAQARQNEALATEKAKRAQEAYKKAQASADQAAVAANSKKVAAAMEEVTAAYAKFEATNSDEDFNLLNAALTKLKGTMDSVGIDISSLPDIETTKDQANIQALIQDMNELILKSEQLDDSVTQAAVNSSAAIDSAGKKGQAEERRDKAGESVGDGPDLSGGEANFDAAITGITQLGMAAASTVTIVTNLFSILQNPDLSGTEKAISIISTVFMGLLTILPAVAGAFVMLKNAGITSIAQLNAAIASNPIGLAIMAIVAAITAAVAAFAIFSDMAYKASPQGKLDAAAESAEALNAQLEETKARAEEVQEAFNNYNTVTDALDECVKGTQEWRDALSEVNNAVIDLIQQFPELTTMVNEAGEKAITRNGDGQLEIADWAQDQILQAQEDAVNAAQGAAYAGQQQVRSAQINVQRSNIKGSLYSEAGGLSASDAVLGGIASILSPGAWIPMLIGGLKSADIAGEADVIADNAEQLSGLVGEELNAKLTEIFDNAGISADVDKWVGIIEGMGSDFTELTAAIQANTEAKNLENQAMADQIMADSGYANSTAGSMALEAGGEIYGQLQEQAYEKYMNTDMADWLGVGTSEGKAMWADYADAMGISDLSGYKVTNYRKDGGVEYEYIDENGQRQTGEATKEMIASTLAAADAAEQLEGNLSELRATIADLNASANAYDKAMASFLSEGNFEGASVGELDSIRQQVGFQDTTGLEGQALTDAQNANKQAVTDYVNAALGGDDGVLSDEEAQAMGYESANAFIEAFTEGLDVDIELPSGLGEGIADQLSVGASKAINDTYEKMGEEGGQAYLDTLQTIYDSVDWSSMTPEEAQQAWDQIANIDWSNMDAADQAAQIVKNLGGEIDTTTEAWENNKVAMQDAMDATYNVASEMEKIAAAKEIASDIEIGAVISEEDYNTLVAYNQELSKYFALLADGTYKMIGDPLDLQQEMIETERKKLEDMIARDQDLLAEAASQYSSGIAALGGDANNLDQYRDTENYVGDDGKNYYNGDNVYRQLDFLQSQGYDQDKITGWLDDLADGGTTTDVLEDIAKAVDETGTEFQEAGQAVNAYNAELLALQTSYAMTAESSAERRQMLEDNKISEDAFLTAEYAAMNEEAWEGLDVEEVQAYADHLQEMGVEGEEAAEDIARGITKMNKGISTLSDNWEDWGDILKSANEEGHEAAKFSEEYAEALNGTKEAVSDILDVSEEFIDSDFISKPENLELIGKAAEGDAEAINELGMALANDIFTDALENVTLDADDMFNFGNLEEKKTYLQQQMADIQSILETSIPTYDLGQTIDDTNLIAKLNNIVAETGMTVEEANAFYRSMGFTPNFKMVEVTQAQSVPITTTYHRLQNYTPEYDDEGNWIGASWDETEWSNTEQVDGGELVSRFPSLAMQTADGEGPMVPSPEIESLTYDGGGAMNNNSTVNKGGNTGNGGKSGGGGGSKFKPEEHVDDQNEVHERYENLIEALEDMTRQLDRFSDAADDAWGAARIRQLRGYNAQIQQIARTQKQLIEETKEYYQIDKNTLMADANIASIALWNPGEYGSLANPEDIRRWIDEEIAAATAGINAEIDAYNTRGVDDQDALDKAKEPYEDRIEYLEGLNEDLDQMLETTDLLQDRLDEQMQNIYDWMANKVQEMEYKLEFKLRIDESDFDRLENLLDRLGDTGIILGDSFETLSDMMSNIMTEQAPAVFEAIDRGWQIANNIVTPENQDYFEGLFGPEVWQEYLDNNGGLPAEIMEFLQDQKDALYDMIDQVVDLALEQLDGIFTKMEQWFEKYARLTDQLDVAVTRMDTLQEILDFKGTNYLTQGGRQVQRRLNEERMNAAGTQAKIAKSQLEQAKEWAAAVEAEYNIMKDAYDNASDEEKSALAGGVNELYQEMIAAQEQVTDFEGEFAESISEIFSTAQEVLEQERELAKANISATIGGLFSDIDEMMNMYSAVDSWSNMHLDDYDKNYLLGDLQSQFDEATENINVDSYEGLAQWQEQLNKYKEDGRDVTQEEVDLLQKALDLEIARANFEDAQNAKNTMRLARDASGNWSYIYSQDQTSSNQADEIARLEYEYKKAYEEMQDSFSENAMDMALQMESIIEGINYQLYFSSEQYRKMIDTQLDMLSQQMIASGATIEQVTSIMGTGIKNWQYDFGQSAAGIITDTQSMEEMIDKFLVALVGTSEGYIPGNTSSGGFYGDWMTAQKDVAQVVNEKGEEIGEKFGLIQEDIGGYIDEIVAGEQGSLHYLKIETQTTQEFMDTYLGYMEDDWSNTEDYLMGQIGEKGDTQQGTITGDIHQIDQAAEEMRNDTLGEFDGLLTGLQNWGINFRSEVQTWIDKLNEYIKKIKEAEIASEKKMDEPYVNEEANKVESQEPPKPSTGGGQESGTGTESANTTTTSRIEALYDLINRGKVGNAPGRKDLIMKAGYSAYEAEIGQKYITYAYPKDLDGYGLGRSAALQRVRSEYGFDTGGYTGEWGSTGKLAFLHEKELVLNKQDTQNILDTVKLMREAVAQKIAALNGRNISGAELKSFADKAQTIEQQVHIEASFPNVSVAAEIEQAFNDLINQVAQYNIKK